MNSRCFVSPRPETWPSIATLKGGSTKTTSASEPSITLLTSSALSASPQQQVRTELPEIAAPARYDIGQPAKRFCSILDFVVLEQGIEC